jgi:hypothetical protein
LVACHIRYFLNLSLIICLSLADCVGYNTMLLHWSLVDCLLLADCVWYNKMLLTLKHGLNLCYIKMLLIVSLVDCLQYQNTTNLVIGWLYALIVCPICAIIACYIIFFLNLIKCLLNLCYIKMPLIVSLVDCLEYQNATNLVIGCHICMYCLSNLIFPEFVIN